METLSKATPETLTQSIADAGGKIKDLLFQEKTESHNLARSQLYEKIKTEIGTKFPMTFPDGVGKLKYEDMLGKLSEPKAATKSETQGETADQIRAKIQSEYDEKMKTERGTLRMNAVRDQIQSAAIARKLDDKYVPVFQALVNSEFDIELNADDKIFFKNKSDGKYLTLNGEHGTATHAAEEILKRYPKMLSTPIQSPNPNTQNQANGNAALQGKIRAGLGELLAFKN